MAGINFILGIDGSKARAQAEAVGKDVKNGVERGTKGSSKQADDLAKSLGTARSNAKQLHEDLLGLSAGGTKSMSSLVGLGGDLAKSLSSVAGVLALVTLAGSYALSKLSEKSKQLGEIITSYLELRLKQSEAAANRLNSVKLREFQRELEVTGESIDRMAKVFEASLAAQRKLAGSEADARIALVDYQEARGIISHEQAAKARIKIKDEELKRIRELEDAETKRVIDDAQSKVIAQQSVLDKAKAEERRGVWNARAIESMKVEYYDAITRGDRKQEGEIVRAFNSLMAERGSQERLERTKIKIYPGDIVPSKEANLAIANSTFDRAINESVLKTNEVAKAEDNLRKATQELADVRAAEANTVALRNRTRAFEDAGAATKDKGETQKARSEDIDDAKKDARENEESEREAEALRKKGYNHQQEGLSLQSESLGLQKEINQQAIDRLQAVKSDIRQSATGNLSYRAKEDIKDIDKQINSMIETNRKLDELILQNKESKHSLAVIEHEFTGK